jgi:hypothetical protein
MRSSSPEPSRLAREKFEAFVRHVLAVPKAKLDARLAAEKERKKRERAKRPPPAH